MFAVREWEGWRLGETSILSERLIGWERNVITCVIVLITSVTRLSIVLSRYHCCSWNNRSLL